MTAFEYLFDSSFASMPDTPKGSEFNPFGTTVVRGMPIHKSLRHILMRVEIGLPLVTPLAFSVGGIAVAGKRVRSTEFEGSNS